MVSVIGSGGVDLSSLYGEIIIQVHWFRKKLALDGAFQVDDVQVFGD
jgi:hypothetical protein